MKRKLWGINPPCSGGEEDEKQPGLWRVMFRSFAGHFDLLQIIPALLLLTIGLLFIYGTGSQTGESVFWEKQLTYLSAGIVIWFVMTFLDYRWLGLAGTILYPVSIFSLIYVLFAGMKLNEAHRWLRIAGFSFQPSEFAKLALILSAAWILSFRKANINRIFWACIIRALTALPVFLIFKEPDFGTALVLVPIAGSIAFAANLKFRYILILLAAALLAAPFTYRHMRTYQKERIMTFLNPERDPRNRGWNAIQAELTVGSGGFAGKGYRNGTHCMLGYLPRTVANSDFIFPVISEETGFLGSFTLILLYGCLLFSILRTALLASDAFGRYLCVGIGTLIAVHVVVNIGMCVRLLPITGLPLPLVSYGGTFLILMMTYLGIVQSVYAHRDKDSFLEL